MTRSSTPTSSLDTRQRILASARQIFADQGYSAGSISKIARHAGVLAGSIYWAFPSKAALFAAALSAAADDWQRAFFDSEPTPTPPGTWRDDLDRFADSFAEGPDFLRLMMIVATERQAATPETLTAAAEVRRHWRERIVAALCVVCAPAAAERLSRLLLQMLDGVFLSLQIERDAVDARALLADVADVIEWELSRSSRSVTTREEGRP